MISRKNMVRGSVFAAISASVLVAVAQSSESSEVRAPPEAGVTPVAAAEPDALRPPRRAPPKDAGQDALCAAILSEEKLDASALGEDRKSTGPRLRCFSTGQFAWAIRADKLAGSSVRQTLLFASAAGARARQVSTLQGVEWPPVLGRHAAMFDFDGDGSPELFAIVTKDVRTFAPASRIFVTVKKGAIVSYPTGGNFQVDAVTDIDRDGRPDLRVSFDLGKRTVCSPGDEGRIELELAARSLPDGTFSLTDPAAVAFVTNRCAATGEGLFTQDEPRDLLLSRVACERMRGKSEAAVVAELQAACAASANDTAKCSGPCRHLPDALVVAKFNPPSSAKPR